MPLPWHQTGAPALCDHAHPILGNARLGKCEGSEPTSHVWHAVYSVRTRPSAGNEQPASHGAGRGRSCISTPTSTATSSIQIPLGHACDETRTPGACSLPIENLERTKRMLGVGDSSKGSLRPRPRNAFTPPNTMRTCPPRPDKTYPMAPRTSAERPVRRRYIP